MPSQKDSSACVHMCKCMEGLLNIEIKASTMWRTDMSIFFFFLKTFNHSTFFP